MAEEDKTNVFERIGMVVVFIVIFGILLFYIVCNCCIFIIALCISFLFPPALIVTLPILLSMVSFFSVCIVLVCVVVIVFIVIVFAIVFLAIWFMNQH